MSNIKLVNNHFECTPPKKPKKITGTVFPTVLYLNPWSTAFEVWCRCTRTYEKPFEGNKYTTAGQTIEPKVFDFLRNELGFKNRIVVPEDVYGKNFFEKTWGDFFPEREIFGGMWDGLLLDESELNVEAVIEVKTVLSDGHTGSFDERWADGQAPTYQSLQASLYAYLLGVDDVYMVAVALSDKNGDYEHPEQVTPSYKNNNVYIDHFKVSERYPEFELMVEKATYWWEDHVLTGISPEYDEKKDKDIVKELTTTKVANTSDFDNLVAEAETLMIEIDNVRKTVAEKEKRLKVLKEAIKNELNQNMGDNTTATYNGSKYQFVLSETVTTTIDKEAMKKDGVYDKYSTLSASYRLTTKEIKGE